MVRTPQETLRSLDILVNNAGIQFTANVEDFPAERWDAIIAINLSGVFHGMKSAIPGMKQRGWGRIGPASGARRRPSATILILTRNRVASGQSTSQPSIPAETRVGQGAVSLLTIWRKRSQFSSGSVPGGQRRTVHIVVNMPIKRAAFAA